MPLFQGKICQAYATFSRVLNHVQFGPSSAACVSTLPLIKGNHRWVNYKVVFPVPVADFPLFRDSMNSKC